MPKKVGLYLRTLEEIASWLRDQTSQRILCERFAKNVNPNCVRKGENVNK